MPRGWLHLPDWHVSETVMPEKCGRKLQTTQIETSELKRVLSTLETVGYGIFLERTSEFEEASHRYKKVCVRKPGYGETATDLLIGDLSEHLLLVSPREVVLHGYRKPNPGLGYELELNIFLRRPGDHDLPFVSISIESMISYLIRG